MSPNVSLVVKGVELYVNISAFKHLTFNLFILKSKFFSAIG